MSVYVSGLTFLGRAPFCGRCRNPWGLIVAICPGWNTGSHDVWSLR